MRIERNEISHSFTRLNDDLYSTELCFVRTEFYMAKRKSFHVTQLFFVERILFFLKFVTFAIRIILELRYRENIMFWLSAFVHFVAFDERELFSFRSPSLVSLVLSTAERNFLPWPWKINFFSETSTLLEIWIFATFKEINVCFHGCTHHTHMREREITRIQTYDGRRDGSFIRSKAVKSQFHVKSEILNYLNY